MSTKYFSGFRKERAKDIFLQVQYQKGGRAFGRNL
jgi:hypothetical protein